MTHLNTGDADVGTVHRFLSVVVVRSVLLLKWDPLGSVL